MDTRFLKETGSEDRGVSWEESKEEGGGGGYLIDDKDETIVDLMQELVNGTTDEAGVAARDTAEQNGAHDSEVVVDDDYGDTGPSDVDLGDWAAGGLVPGRRDRHQIGEASAMALAQARADVANDQAGAQALVQRNRFNVQDLMADTSSSSNDSNEASPSSSALPLASPPPHRKKRRVAQRQGRGMQPASPGDDENAVRRRQDSRNSSDCLDDAMRVAPNQHKDAGPDNIDDDEVEAVDRGQASGDISDLFDEAVRHL